ncbi:MAG: PPC domain-containing protein [Lyngbya sp.]|nr:PPC domain-containing protein [Lyngbya sp.]
MHQIQFWVLIASLLTVFPAHALGPSSTIQSRLGGASTNPSSDEIKAIEFDPLLAQETPAPEPAPEPEATPEPEPAPEPESNPPTENPAPAESPTPEATPAPAESPAPAPTPSPEAAPESPETNPQSSDLILDEQGELGEGDSVLASDGSLYDEYTFEGTEGQEVTISLDSSEFDTYLAIFTPDNKLLEEHDDINQSNSNSQITVTLPSDGVYRVIVNSYDDKGRGKYNLKIK